MVGVKWRSRDEVAFDRRAASPREAQPRQTKLNNIKQWQMQRAPGAVFAFFFFFSFQFSTMRRHASWSIIFEMTGENPFDRVSSEFSMDLWISPEGRKHILYRGYYSHHPSRCFASLCFDYFCLFFFQHYIIR